MSIMVSWDGLKWYKNDRGINPRESAVLKTLYSLSTRNTIFVDVGAHIGFFAIRLAKVCKHVHAIEPNPESLEILETNIKLNNITNITIHPYACGNSPAKQPIYVADTCTTLYPRDRRKTVEVEVKQMDELIDHCDLVKMDIEGYEEQALQGANRIINLVKPIWIIEHHDLGLGAQYYPETKGASERIAKIMKDYIKITFDEGRATYIPKEKLQAFPKSALMRLVRLGVTHKIIKNIENRKAWYHDLPYTWWYSLSINDFLEEVGEHALFEPEWLNVVSNI
jgi:FkbM family methyltransferase